MGQDREDCPDKKRTSALFRGLSAPTSLTAQPVPSKLTSLGYPL
jgi:hypothetical protein